MKLLLSKTVPSRNPTKSEEGPANEFDKVTAEELEQQISLASERLVNLEVEVDCIDLALYLALRQLK